ncbi:uncharacterized protein RJT20DRAFT_125033 [Scheffersomyces xylosifermentans]|uniref:uncharacterized protein n=1 Tax=Scheffersomyces xylosifermentans TaxID=1304137 RepID=UPI00315D44A6
MSKVKAKYTSRSGSFFAEERQKLISSLEVPLLESVLTYLPHHQLTTEAEDDTWEIVAINLNNQQFIRTMEESDKEKHLEELPTLNGLFVKEIYNDLYQKFISNLPFWASQPGQPPYQVDDETLKRKFDSKANFLLFELYRLRGLGAETLAKISREKYEEQQRKAFSDKRRKRRSFNVTEGQYIAIEDVDGQRTNGEKGEEEDADDEVFSKKKSLEVHRAESLEKQLEVLKKELVKQKKRHEQIVRENASLLELNHELVLQLKDAELGSRRPPLGT